MLNKFTIGNFQSFSSPMDIELRKLNLIYGANSNGKSAIFRALRLVSSNITPRFATSDSPWSFNFPELSLQSFMNAVHMNSARKNMAFGFSFDVPVVAQRSSLDKEIKETQERLNEVRYQMNNSGVVGEERVKLARKLREFQVRISQIRTGSTFNIPIRIDFKLSAPGVMTEVSFSVEDFYSQDHNRELPGFTLAFIRTNVSGSWEWNFKDGVRKYGDIAVIQNSLKYLESSMPSFSLGQDRRMEVFRNNHSTDKSAIESFDSKLAGRALDSAYVVFGNNGGIEISGGESYPAPTDLAPIYKTVEKAIEVLWRCFYREMSNIEFVGPIREIPQLVLGKDSWFHSLKEDGRSKLDNSANRFKAAKKAFEDLTDGHYGFEFNELEVNSQPTGFWALQITSSAYKTNLQNVGVGISQVLPVVFALFGANKNNRISRLALIEQPELHLHPKLQSELADVVITALNTVPDRQLFIETHSENLLLRIMRRIRESNFENSKKESVLASGDVSVMFIEKGTTGAFVKKLSLSAHGEMLSEWPVDFVDLRLDDVI